MLAAAIDSSSSLLTRTRYCHQDIQAFKDIHLLEPSPIDERVHLSLATPVQQHQATLRPHQQIHSCFRDTEKETLDRDQQIIWLDENKPITRKE